MSNNFHDRHDDIVQLTDTSGHEVMDWDRANLSDGELFGVFLSTAKWNIADAAGDKTAMDAAHAQAVAIRTQYLQSNQSVNSSGYVQTVPPAPPQQPAPPVVSSQSSNNTATPPAPTTMVNNNSNTLATAATQTTTLVVTVAVPVLPLAAVGLRSLTRLNFRYNLIISIGPPPGDGYEAHHIVPNQFALQFGDSYVHDPVNGMWLPVDFHRSLHASGYNQQLGLFTNPYDMRQQGLMLIGLG